LYHFQTTDFLRAHADCLHFLPPGEEDILTLQKGDILIWG